MQRRYVIWMGVAGAALILLIGVIIFRPSEEERRISALLINENDHILGRDDAGTSLVAYLDIACGTCSGLHDTLRTLDRESEGDLKIAIRNLPESALHPNAELAAQAFESAALQDAALPMLELLFDQQRDWVDQNDPIPLFTDYAEQLKLDSKRFVADMDSRKVARKIKKDLHTAETLQIKQAPVFFLDGTRLQEQRTHAELKRLVLDVVYE